MHDRAREGLVTHNNSAFKWVVLPKLWEDKIIYFTMLISKLKKTVKYPMSITTVNLVYIIMRRLQHVYYQLGEHHWQ
jgi:hypothetical protein